MWQVTVTRSFPAHTVTVQSWDRDYADTTNYRAADALARSVWPEARLSHKGTTALGYAVRTYTGAPAHA